jgi:hypothetical protein
MGKRKLKRQPAEQCPVCLYKNTLLQLTDQGMVHKCLDCDHTWPHKGPRPGPREPA